MAAADQIVLVPEAAGRFCGLAAVTLKANGWKAETKNNPCRELDLRCPAFVSWSKDLGKPTKFCLLCWNAAGKAQAC